MAKRQTPRLDPVPSKPTLVKEKSRHWRRHVWRLLAIWGLALVAYSNSFQGALVFDSASVIGQDPRIRQATRANVESILTGGYWQVTSTAGLYRPLTTLTYLGNFALLGGGTRPAGYHWINFLLHAVNVALVYGLGILLLGETAPAFALAALWGLHPLLTESVTNIVGRADLLAALGTLAGLLVYATGRHRLAWPVGLAAAQAVAIFSKESGVVLPALMLVYDLARPERAPQSRRRAIPYAAVTLPILVFFAVRSGLGLHMLIEPAENPLIGADFWTARLTAVKVIGEYLGLFLWPVHLSADYSYNAVPLFGSGDLPLLMALGVALTVFAVACRRGIGKPFLFFLGLFVVALLPASNLVVPIASVMAERFLYLPSVGLAGCAVAAVHMFARKRPGVAPIAWATLAVVCLGFTARTYARNSDWQEELSLWTSTVTASPGSAKAHYNLAKELELIPSRLPDAINEYREAIRIEPDRVNAYDNLANVLSRIPGRLPDAVDAYRQALRIAPDRAEVHNDLANALARMPGGLSEAIAEYQAALRIQPENAEIHYNLANALSATPGRLPDAIAEYRAALRIQPDHADAHNNLANALAAVPGRVAEAIAEYQSALKLQPDLVAAHNNLGNALSGIPGRLAEAIVEYQAALRIQPTNAEAHNNLGNALAGMGHMAEAIVEFQAALRSDPDLLEAHISLAKAFSLTPGRRADAIAEYEAALRIRPDPDVRQALNRLR